MRVRRDRAEGLDRGRTWVRKLEEHDALKHTIVVVASAATPAALQYISAYSGVTMGEYFMGQRRRTR